MSYAQVRDQLRTAPRPTVSTFPDGSVDHFCTLSAGSVGPLRSRNMFAREIQDTNRSSFRLKIDTTEPGGQAVNVATQLHDLDADVTCYGHLDHPVLQDLPFPTVSMGDPATVYAFNFPDSDIMFAEGAIGDDWTLDDLAAVADLDTVCDVDAICCSNWMSFPGLETAFHRLGDMDLPRIPFVVDPGDIIGSPPPAIDALHDALGSLQASFDVVYNGNRQEIRATATTLPDPPSDDLGRLDAIREQTGITAAVLHAPETAAVATNEESYAVDSLPIEEVSRHTGGGDRFTGGLGYALALDWDWPTALACGNTCASYYVEHGDTATVDDLTTYLADR